MSKRRKIRSSIHAKIKTKVQRVSNTHVHQRGMNLSNQFQPLADMDTEDAQASTSNQIPVVKKPKIPRIPPIIVTQKSFNPNQIQALLLPDVTFKFISLGVKISFGIQDSYDKCIEYLKQNKIEFFTHRLKNNIFKAILSGLPQSNTNDIKNELNSKYNLNVADVRELQTSYFNKNSRLYLISFENKEINLGQLKQIKVVNYTIVNWLRFSPKFKGPIQCRRCLLFGHGAENCHRQSSCMLCASTEHSSDSCLFKDVPDNQLVIYRCGNCHSKGLQSNHKANDPKCPSMLEYQNIRNHVRVKNSKRGNRSSQSSQDTQFNRSSQQNQSTHSNRQHQFNVNAPEFNQNHFPSLPGNHRSSNSSFNFSNSFANVTKNNLLSAEEFFNIFDDALTKFYECKTLSDQFALIASLLRRAIR